MLARCLSSVGLIEQTSFPVSPSLVSLPLDSVSSDTLVCLGTPSQVLLHPCTPTMIPPYFFRKALCPFPFAKKQRNENKAEGMSFRLVRLKESSLSITCSSISSGPVLHTSRPEATTRYALR